MFSSVISVESSEIDLSEFEDSRDNVEGNDNNGTGRGDDNGNNGTGPDDDQTTNGRAEPASVNGGMIIRPLFMYGFFKLS